MNVRTYYQLWVRMASPLDNKPVAVGALIHERADADLLVEHLTNRGVECGWSEIKEGFFVCACCGQTRRCACGG